MMMKRGIRWTIMAVLWVGGVSPALSQAPTLTQVESPLVDERSYVGNIYGRVVDGATGRPVPRARIYVFDPEIIWPAVRRQRLYPNSKRSEQDPFEAPQYVSISDADGKFLIPGVATPFPFHEYTVVALASGYSMMIVDRVRAFPGASMALRVDFRLDPDSPLPVLYHGDDPSAPFRYRHEELLYERPFDQLRMGDGVPLAANGVGPFSATVFATREGLVGGTTANGHVIVSNDHFVALPSRRALCSNGGREFEVEISHGAQTAVLPQWDVGPWNTRDDYWNPWSVRESFQDLPQGLPEAQATFENNYNQGRDGAGRKVLNRAGIDLADGTFWQDLQLSDNSFIQVKFLWVVSYALAAGTGQRVSSIASASTLRTGTALITPDTSQQPVSAYLRVTQTAAGTVFSETTVPQAPLLQQGLMVVDVASKKGTQVVLSNPSAEGVNVSLTLLNPDGSDASLKSNETDALTQSILLGPRAQQVFTLANTFAGRTLPTNFLGALWVQASKPIGALALRTRTNERSEWLTTTVSMADPAQRANAEILRAAKGANDSVMHPARAEDLPGFLPILKDGAGFSTTFELANSTERTLTGTLAFFDNAGAPWSLSLGGPAQSSVRYTLNAHSSAQLISSGERTSLQSGYAVLIPDRGTIVPQATTLITARSGGFTVSQAALSSTQFIKSFRAHIDRRTGHDVMIALVNPGRVATEVQTNLTSLNGATHLASESFFLAPHQRMEIQASTRFTNLPDDFEGILRVESSDLITSGAMHFTTNARGETIFSALPLLAADVPAAVAGSTPPSFMAYLADGNGAQTELVMVNPNVQGQRSGTVNLFSAAGTTLNLNFR